MGLGVSSGSDDHFKRWFKIAVKKQQKITEPGSFFSGLPL